MTHTRERPAGRPGVQDEHWQALTSQYTPAWRQWASAADIRRMSARQAAVVAALRAGAASTPEAALRLVGGRYG